MADDPTRDPMGARPVLPAPRGAPAERAKEMFEQHVEKSPARSYPIAESKVTEPAPPAPIDPHEEDTLISRPPRGAPTVRPSVKAPTPAARESSEVLEQTAESLMLRSEPGGRLAFDVSFKDDVFDDLACRIEIEDGEVIAIFYATDANTARLLEAEAGRLRVQLEAKGMRVADVRVEQAPT